MKNSVFLLVLISLSLFAFSQENPTAQWAKNNIVIDGNINDWNSQLKHYDNETSLFFDFKNDSTNLYLCFQTKNEMNQSKIMQSGMKIILSDKSNGKHKAIINFPLADKYAAKKVEAPDKIKPDPLSTHQTRQAAFLLSDTMMELKGFINQNGLISIKNISGVNAAINWDSANTLTYEIKIPLKELYGNDYEERDVAKGISMNVVINAMSVSDAKKNMENEYSGRSHLGEDRVGAAPGGNYQDRYNRAVMFQKTELKQKIVLSAQN
ncbi:MAG: hypothetical protein ABI297_02655 [Ginsengibacter sp.]